MKTKLLAFIFAIFLLAFLRAGTITGVGSISGAASIAGPSSAPALIFEQVGSLGQSYTVSGVPLDLDSNRYLIEVDGVTWTDIANYSGMTFGSADGAAFFQVRPESGLMVMYESNSNNASSFSSTGRGSVSLWSPANGVAYKIGIECGLGQATVNKDASPILNYSSDNTRNARALYQRVATTASRPNPASMVKLTLSAGVSATALRIYRRELNTINNLVLLGDSITYAQQWWAPLQVALGNSWLINDHGVGYRQSRELVTAIATPFPGDAYNPANYYADVAGQYRSGAKSNWVILGIGTNDIVNYNRAVTGAGPEDGGYTATDTINNILAAITAIRANNAGWKVAVRTVLNCDGISAGGSYATAETARQAINASITSGTIFAAADKVFDMDNIFAPSASRTDGTAYNGPMYNASFWPKYSDNTATFDSFHVHPLAGCYQAIANYIAARMP